MLIMLLPKLKKEQPEVETKLMTNALKDCLWTCQSNVDRRSKFSPEQQYVVASQTIDFYGFKLSW